MNAKLYSKCNMQSIRDGKEFFELVIDKLQWSDLSNQVIMDVGCGPGTNLPNLLINKFPEVKKIIGIDINSDMIDVARDISAHPKIEYAVGDIECKSELKNWENEISIIVSIYCLNWVKHQEIAFQNIFNLLKPEGEAALLFCLSNSFWDSLPDFIENSRWKKFVQYIETNIPESHYKKLDASYYKPKLEKIGFEVILCDEVDSHFEFLSEKDYKGFLASICTFTNHIPAGMLEDFTCDLYEISKKSLKDSKTFYCKYIRLILRKPSCAKAENTELKESLQDTKF